MVATVGKMMIPIALDLFTQESIRRQFPDHLAKSIKAGTTVGLVSMLLISTNLDRIQNVVMISSYVAYKFFVRFVISENVASQQAFGDYFRNEDGDRYQQATHQGMMEALRHTFWPEKG